MSHSSDAPAALNGSAEPADPDPSEGQSRGFLSRIREVFAPPDTAAGTPSRHLIPAEPAMPRLADLRKLRIEDVAVPSADIIAVPVTSSLDELVEVFRDTGFTRIPVYDGSLDHPLGLVNLKDLALRHGFRAEDVEFDLRALLRPLLFVPPSMQAGILLQKMQAERKHMALVIDEYGGTDGLITIEDLVEIVVGEIDDEHDETAEASFVRDKDGSWLVQAITELEVFEAAIGHPLTAHDDIDGEEVDTLGGLVFMLAGHVPARGEVVQHPDGPEFEVIDSDPRRILRLRVRLPLDWVRRADA